MQKIEMISLDRLHPHPDNPRKNLGDLTELTDAIKAKGILQNLTVVPFYSTQHQRVMEGLYTVIIGHRRMAAAKLAGLTEVPCVIANMTPQEQFETMMVENIQRSDLTVYEQAEGFQLMLDMGSTVEQVAKKTGVSETTVRNRAKLTKLDKKGFKKGQDRGATMTDFLKLNAIKDEDRRNKVLEFIGTADFNQKLKSAIADQEYAEFLAGEIRKLEEADWIRERTDEKCGGGMDYPYWRCINKWNKNPIERPDDADVADYVYVISGPNEVNIYRKGPAKVKELTPEEKRKQKLRKDLDDIAKQLKAISTTHQEMRDEFVKDFTAVNTYSEEIATFAAKVFLTCYSGPSATKLGNLMGIPVKNANSYNASVDQKAWDILVRNRPFNTLLCVAAAKLNGDERDYYGRYWDREINDSVPQHSGNSLTDLFYSGLKSMGYEMSEEEIQMQTGTHPLFQEAQQLVEDYKKGAVSDG